VAGHGCKQEILREVGLQQPLLCSPLLLNALFSQNQMFSKFNALGLDNLLQSSLSGATDVTSDIESKLKS
jgi:hypothetical protein